MRKPQVKLKPGVLDCLAIENDTNKSGLVALTGMSPTQIYRVTTGKCKVGADFIASILAKNPGKRFEDFFFIQ